MTASSLASTARKAAAGAPISEDDARQLMATTDLVTVGMISTEARRVRVGDRVTYVRVAEIAAELAAATPAATPASGWPPPGAREIRITGAPASLGDVVASARAVALSLGASAGRGTGHAPLTAFSLADLWVLASGDTAKLRAIAE